MKKTTFTFLLFIPLLALSQAYQGNAPWMKNSNLKKKGKLTLQEISLAAENYFKTIDRNKKGSGLKPFKRWEYHWSFYTKPDGTVAPASDLWKAWRQKNELNSSNQNNANDTSNWTSIGPYSHTNTASWSSGQGRVNAIAVDPNNANTYYVGAPAGGIWKSTDAGVNWQPLTDYLPQIGVSGIAIDPNNSNIIYIATGDDDASDSYAVGVYKSTDGGTTWNPAGNIKADSMNDIYIDPNNSNTLWVATSDGVYKSINAGANWTLKLSANIIDLKMKPGDATTFYAASGSGVYRSTDSGNSFIPVTISGLSDSRRIALAVTPANPNLVYFVSYNGDSSVKNGFNGVYKSIDSGVNFTKTAENDDIFGGSQSWYDLAITVSDTNADTVFIGVLNIWKSTNGGDDFVKINNWNAPTAPSYTHADIHYLNFIDGKFFAGTDGGIYVSTNHGTNFTDLTKNLAISQFYKISVASQNSNKIVGGLQDNGGYAFDKDQNWNNYFGADGMDCAVNSTNPNNYFGFIQYGASLYETTDSGLSRANRVGAPSAETGTNDSGGRWVTPLVSNSKGEMYSGYSQLYKLVNGNWSKVSNQFFGGDIYHIEIDPNNDNNIYLSIGSSLYKSNNAGKTFSPLPFSNGTINSIEISNNDSNVGWITINSSVFKITNLLGTTPTFTNITGNLPSEGKIVVRHHPGHKDNRIYLGTTLGVYYTDDTLTEWITFDNKLPNTAVRDLEINEKDAKLYAATYGRGVFVTSITKSLPDNDVKLVSIDSPVNDSKGCGSISPALTVRNQGTNAITSITVNYSIDGGANATYNWSGNLASEASTQITIPEFSISKGSHTINIETVINNDSYNSNNKSFSTFDIAGSNTKPTTVNSFESSDDELTVETSGGLGGDLWKRGTATKTLLNNVGSGTNAYYTNLTGNYSDKTTSYLYTLCYDLSLVTNPILSFKMAFDIEENWDHLYVEYTTNQGQTWNILGTSSDTNWYNSNSTANGLPGKQWTGEGEDFNARGGTNATVRDYSYDLAAFTNEKTIMFRFKFVADDLTNEEGAMVDDLVITGVLPVGEYDQITGLSIYPNPSNGVFNINWSQQDHFSISVFDLTGKLLLQEKSDTKSIKKFSLDLSKLNKGVYFAKIKVGEKQSNRKLIIK